MTKKTTRRAILAGTAVASVAALPMVSAAAMPTGWDARIGELWAEHTKLTEEYCALSQKRDEAVARLPEWASSGPQFLRSDGTYCGTDVGWPRIENAPLPEGGVIINVRPSPHEIRKRFETNIKFHGRKVRRAAKSLRTADGSIQRAPSAAKRGKGQARDFGS